MAKFDKNIKNDFLNEEELFETGEYDEYDTEFDEYEDDADDQEMTLSDGNLLSGEEDSYGHELSDPDQDDTEDGSNDESREPVEPADTAVDPQLKWYVVHTYSGYENKVKVSIEKMVENRGMQDLVRQVEIPTEDVLEETKSGERKVKKSKLFPGYVIVNMILTSESWYLIRNTQGVTGFVGQGADPIPLTDEEVRHMGIDRTRIRVDLEIGDRVRITDGAYRDYMLVVDDIDLTKQKIKGRLGQVTMDIPFDLVEKIV